MNVYVISEVWDHDGATVIGAAVERSGAERIGDSRELSDQGWDGSPQSWAPWEERVDEASGSCTWYRVALLADGSVHHALSQEIVCVPLAGYIADQPTTEVGREVVDSIRAFTTPRG